MSLAPFIVKSHPPLSYPVIVVGSMWSGRCDWLSSRSVTVSAVVWSSRSPCQGGGCCLG